MGLLTSMRVLTASVLALDSCKEKLHSHSEEKRDDHVVERDELHQKHC